MFRCLGCSMCNRTFDRSVAALLAVNQIYGVSLAWLALFSEIAALSFVFGASIASISRFPKEIKRLGTPFLWIGQFRR